jgi:SNF2 family DNA or RNA helicase
VPVPVVDGWRIDDAQDLACLLTDAAQMAAVQAALATPDGAIDDGSVRYLQLPPAADADAPVDVGGRRRFTDFQLPLSMFRALYPYQRDGVAWLWSLHRRCRAATGSLGRRFDTQQLEQQDIDLDADEQAQLMQDRAQAEARTQLLQQHMLMQRMQNGGVIVPGVVDAFGRPLAQPVRRRRPTGNPLDVSEDEAQDRDPSDAEEEEDREGMGPAAAARPPSRVSHPMNGLENGPFGRTGADEDTADEVRQALAKRSLRELNSPDRTVGAVPRTRDDARSSMPLSKWLETASKPGGDGTGRNGLSAAARPKFRQSSDGGDFGAAMGPGQQNSVFRKSEVKVPGGILADDMGLGKTVQVVAFVTGLFFSEGTGTHTVLIVAPVSVLPVWESEFKKWAPELRVVVFHGDGFEKDKRAFERLMRKGGVMLTTFGMVTNRALDMGADPHLLPALEAVVSKPKPRRKIGAEDEDDDGGVAGFVRPVGAATPGAAEKPDVQKRRIATSSLEFDVRWDAVILDEGHKIKNPSTAVHRCCLAIPAAFRLLLSGTPIQNSLDELHALFTWCTFGSVLKSKRSFNSEIASFILAARDRDADARDIQEGKRASTILLRQVWPHLMRREKSKILINHRATRTLEYPPVICRSSGVTGDANQDEPYPSSGNSTAHNQPEDSQNRRASGGLVIGAKKELVLWSTVSEIQRALYSAYLTSEDVKDALSKVKGPLTAIDVLRKISCHPLLLGLGFPEAMQRLQLSKAFEEKRRGMIIEQQTILRERHAIFVMHHQQGLPPPVFPPLPPIPDVPTEEAKNLVDVVSLEADEDGSAINSKTKLKKKEEDRWDKRLLPETSRLIDLSGKLQLCIQLLRLLFQKKDTRVLIFSQSKRMLDIFERILEDTDFGIAIDPHANVGEGLAGRKRPRSSLGGEGDTSNTDWNRMQPEDAELNKKSHMTIVERKGGVKYVRIDGEVTLSDRPSIVAKFNNRTDYRVCLLTTGVGALGLTLTGADRVIIYDPSWNPATDSQAVDRAYRVGQKKDVVTYRLITCGTVEEKMYQRQVFKGGLTSSVMTASSRTKAGRDAPRLLSQTELRDLFTLGSTDESQTQKLIEQLLPKDADASEGQPDGALADKPFTSSEASASPAGASAAKSRFRPETLAHLDAIKTGVLGKLARGITEHDMLFLLRKDQLQHVATAAAEGALGTPGPGGVGPRGFPGNFPFPGGMPPRPPFGLPPLPFPPHLMNAGMIPMGPGMTPPQGSPMHSPYLIKSPSPIGGPISPRPVPIVGPDGRLMMPPYPTNFPHGYPYPFPFPSPRMPFVPPAPSPLVPSPGSAPVRVSPAGPVGRFLPPPPLPVRTKVEPSFNEDEVITVRASPVIISIDDDDEEVELPPRSVNAAEPSKRHPGVVSDSEDGGSTEDIYAFDNAFDATAQSDTVGAAWPASSGRRSAVGEDDEDIYSMKPFAPAAADPKNILSPTPASVKKGPITAVRQQSSLSRRLSQGTGFIQIDDSDDDQPANASGAAPTTTIVPVHVAAMDDRDPVMSLVAIDIEDFDSAHETADEPLDETDVVPSAPPLPVLLAAVQAGLPAADVEEAIGAGAFTSPASHNSPFPLDSSQRRKPGSAPRRSSMLAADSSTREKDKGEGPICPRHRMEAEAIGIINPTRCRCFPQADGSANGSDAFFLASPAPDAPVSISDDPRERLSGALSRLERNDADPRTHREAMEAAQELGWLDIA